MKPKRQNSDRPGRVDDANAFLPVRADGASLTAKGADAEFLGEEYIGSALGGEAVYGEANDEVSEDEEGGPFLILGEDGSLPVDEEGDVLQADGTEPVQQTQADRGANWIARGT